MAVERIDEAAVRVQIAMRLRERRIALGFTQEVLASRAEISCSFMSELEAGDTSGNVLIYLRLARALGCSVGYLLEGEDRQVKDALRFLERIGEGVASIGLTLEAMKERQGGG